VADQAIAQYHGTPFQKSPRMAFRKLTGQLAAAARPSLPPRLHWQPLAPVCPRHGPGRHVHLRPDAPGQAEALRPGQINPQPSTNDPQPSTAPATAPVPASLAASPMNRRRAWHGQL